MATENYHLGDNGGISSLLLGILFIGKVFGYFYVYRSIKPIGAMLTSVGLLQRYIEPSWSTK